MRNLPKSPLLVTVMSTLIALASLISAVPRIRLVEAITLFATAFAAGAGFATAVAGLRRRR